MEAERFRYVGYDVDGAAGIVRCRYALDDTWSFEERFAVPGGGLDWASPKAEQAVRILYLLAGVSYYKTAAPPIVDLGDTPVGDVDRDVLRSFYVDGLGEYAYRNELDLGDLRFVGGSAALPVADTSVADRESPRRPLVPFGGGVDSIVTVELVRRAHADVALFVMNRAGDRFAAIEAAAAVTGLPVLRVEREIDPQLLRSSELGFRNGHVPVTGIVSAAAVLAAVLHGRTEVVMSNEWSSSRGNVEVDGRVVNHQFSKGDQFETAFRTMLGAAIGDEPDWFSLLRARTELWIARQFETLGHYHRVFRSCNRAFHLDAGVRHDTWCGRCDKCCFIDLILAPYLSAATLADVFGGDEREPLHQADLLPVFEDLLGLSNRVKPFECVGDVDECRAAVVLAAARHDRSTADVVKEPVLHALLAALGPSVNDVGNTVDRLLSPMGADHVPDAYAVDALLG